MSLEELAKLTPEEFGYYKKQKEGDYIHENATHVAWQAIRQRQLEALKPELEYLDKVAITAMNGLLSEHHISYKDCAEASYEYAQAMLAEKKRIETELLVGSANDQ